MDELASQIEEQKALFPEREKQVREYVPGVARLCAATDAHIKHMAEQRAAIDKLWAS
jgi:hypothetical protein